MKLSKLCFFDSEKRMEMGSWFFSFCGQAWDLGICENTIAEKNAKIKERRNTIYYYPVKLFGRDYTAKQNLKEVDSRGVKKN